MQRRKRNNETIFSASAFHDLYKDRDTPEELYIGLFDPLIRRVIKMNGWGDYRQDLEQECRIHILHIIRTRAYKEGSPYSYFVTAIRNRCVSWIKTWMRHEILTVPSERITFEDEIHEDHEDIADWNANPNDPVDHQKTEHLKMVCRQTSFRFGGLRREICERTVREFCKNPDLKVGMLAEEIGLARRGRYKNVSGVRFLVEHALLRLRYNVLQRVDHPVSSTLMRNRRELRRVVISIFPETHLCELLDFLGDKSESFLSLFSGLKIDVPTLSEIATACRDYKLTADFHSGRKTIREISQETRIPVTKVGHIIRRVDASQELSLKFEEN